MTDKETIKCQDRSIRATEQWERIREQRNSRWTTDVKGHVHIPMSRGIEAIIDATDRTKASGYTWCPRFSHTRKSDGVSAYYAESLIPGGNGKRIFLHNLLLEPESGFEVDHIDRNGLNCIRSNLRLSTPSQNRSNSISIRAVRPFRGVYKRRNGKWNAKIMVKGKYIYRCGFIAPVDAARVYNDLALQYFGEFATLNKLEGERTGSNED